jgi:hypothetical protein
MARFQISDHRNVECMDTLWQLVKRVMMNAHKKFVEARIFTKSNSTNVDGASLGSLSEAPGTVAGALFGGACVSWTGLMPPG